MHFFTDLIASAHAAALRDGTSLGASHHLQLGKALGEASHAHTSVRRVWRYQFGRQRCSGRWRRQCCICHLLEFFYLS